MFDQRATMGLSGDCAYEQEAIEMVQEERPGASCGPSINERISRAVVFSGPGRPLELRMLAVQDPEGAEILVRVIGCVLCGSDGHTFLGRRATPLPTILGHEILGRIEALGLESPRTDLRGRPLRVGDRVTWTLVASCGACFYCQRQLPQKCLHAVKYGHEALAAGKPNGGLADYCMLAPGTGLVRIDESLSDEMACPVNCATATVAAAGDLQGRTALVLGAGMLGLTACAMVRAAGASEVICCETQPERLRRSADFGSTRSVAPDGLRAVVNQATGNRGVDVAFELAGTTAAFEMLWPLVRLGETLVLVGAVYPTRPVELPVEQLVRRNLMLRGVHNYTAAHLLAAVEFLERSDYPWKDLVSEWLPLEKAEHAFDRAQNPEILRVGVRP